MNALAMVALLFAAPLVQSDADEHGCKAALNELAVSAHAAMLATDTADTLVVKLDELETKLDACRKKGERNESNCRKIEASMKSIEAELDAAEDQLTFALETVDAAYDEFDVACSWEDPDTHVQVRHSTPQRQTRKPAARTASTSAARSASRGR